MGKQSEEFIRRMLGFLPSTEEEYKNIVEEYNNIVEGCDTIPETIVIESAFMPKLLEILNINKEKELLKEIFEYFEKVSNCDDEHLLNLFSVTVLEILGNDRKILQAAREYMGKKTYLLQIEADIDLGRETS